MLPQAIPVSITMITSWTRYDSTHTMRHLISVLVVVLCLSTTTSALIETNTEKYMLQRTILVEERTAIWCKTCAEVDPELAVVAKSHGSRTAIVGIHVTDEFENDASLARLDYQMQTDDTNYGTPTFFVDGVKTAEGYDAWQEVQNRILSQENNRIAPEEMAMTLVNGEVELPIPDYGQITLMILEHEKPVPADADNPGEDTRDRVLIGMRIVDSNGSISEFGEINMPKIWSLVMVHEPVEGGTPYGVVEVTNIEYDSNEDGNLLLILFVCSFIGALLIFYPNKISVVPEEE